MLLLLNIGQNYNGFGIGENDYQSKYMIFFKTNLKIINKFTGSLISKYKNIDYIVKLIRIL